MMHQGYGGNGPTLLGVAISLLIVAYFLIILRGYAASRTKGKWRWDFIFAALAVGVGSGAIAGFMIAVSYGLGNDVAKVKFADLFQITYWVYTAIWTGLVAATLAKTSMVALMLEVQGPSAKKRRWALLALTALFTSVNIVQVFLSMLQCNPPQKLWKPYLEGECPLASTAEKFSYLQGGVGVFSDLVLALWPVGIAWNLQTSRRVKVGFCALMGLGLIPAIASLIRMLSLQQATHSENPTRDLGPFLIWAVIELWLIIILTSIPVLRPLFLRVFYGIKERTGLGNTRNDTHVTASRYSSVRPGTSGTNNGRSKFAAPRIPTLFSRKGADADDSSDEFGKVTGEKAISRRGSKNEFGAITVSRAFEVNEGRDSTLLVPRRASVSNAPRSASVATLPTHAEEKPSADDQV